MTDEKKTNFQFSDEFYKKAAELEIANPPGGLMAISPELYEKLESDVAQQTVVIRKDLNMRKGKIAAQAGHAFMKDLLDKWRNKTDVSALSQAEIAYYFTKFTKIVVSVDSEVELDDVYAKAKAAGLTCHMIIDSGKTEFNNVPTKTCLCIGPHFKSEIDPITRHLKLF